MTTETQNEVLSEGLAGGLEIEHFAVQQGLTTQQVWDLLKAGKIFGKASGGRLFVFDEESSFLMGDKSELDSPKIPGFLPPLPGQNPRTIVGAQKDGEPAMNLPALARDPANHTEMTLFLDHLSLAKEENREILHLARESVARVTSLSDTVIAVKDSLIEAKDREIQYLRQLLDGKEKAMTKLQQENEDLQILNRALSSLDK